jgi:hypothetical protein
MPRQPWLMGLAAGLWAAVISLLLAMLPMLILWLSSLDAGPRESVRLGGLLWLVANGSAVSISGVTMTLLPWGLAIIPLLLLGYAGTWATRRSDVSQARELVWIVVPGVAVYTLIGGVIAEMTFEPSSRVDLLHGVLACLVIAVIGLGAGAVHGSGVLATGVIPAVVGVPLRAGIVALATIVGLGALGATLSLIAHIDDAITLTQSLGAGLGGGAGLLILGLAYVPVMAVWGASYLLGAGIGLGPEATMSPFLAASAPVPLPPFPLLAALPPQPPPLAWLLPILGVLAGALAGALIGRRLRHEQRLVRLAAAGGAAAVAGVGLAGLAWLASGSLGTESLVGLGPDPAVVGVLSVVLVLIGAVPTALVPSPPARPVLSVATVTDPVSGATADAGATRDAELVPAPSPVTAGSSATSGEGPVDE